MHQQSIEESKSIIEPAKFIRKTYTFCLCNSNSLTAPIEDSQPFTFDRCMDDETVSLNGG